MSQINLLSLAAAIVLIRSTMEPEPFFGVWSLQREGSQTAFRHGQRQYLIINPVDLERMTAALRAPGVKDPLLSITALPFMGVPIRDLDHDGVARSEYLGAYMAAGNGQA